MRIELQSKTKIVAVKREHILQGDGSSGGGHGAPMPGSGGGFGAPAGGGFGGGGGGWDDGRSTPLHASTMQTPLRNDG